MPLKGISRGKKQQKLVIEEADQVSTNDEKVYVYSLMGVSKELINYYISEVDLIKNYVVLKKRKGLEADG